MYSSQKNIKQTLYKIDENRYSERENKVGYNITTTTKSVATDDKKFLILHLTQCNVITASWSLRKINILFLSFHIYRVYKCTVNFHRELVMSGTRYIYFHSTTMTAIEKTARLLIIRFSCANFTVFSVKSDPSICHRHFETFSKKIFGNNNYFDVGRLVEPVHLIQQLQQDPLNFAISWKNW